MAFIVKDIIIKNFLSIGNVAQVVNFNRNELVLILGENIDLGGDDSGSKNGVGKSAMINAVSYGLFGQALSNIKKENLINKTNGKGMSVTVEFEVDSDEYKIERGRKPNFLRFFKNNVEQKDDSENKDDAQGDSRETQHDIDKLLGMSHDMFKHIVALNTYNEPFLNMRINDQRTIIEQLLGITLLSEKAEALRDLIKSGKEAITTESIQIKAIQSANSRIEDQIKNLNTRKKLWLGKKESDILEYTTAIIELKNINIDLELENHKLLELYQEKFSNLSSINSTLKQIQDQISREEKDLTKIFQEIASLEQMKCNACGQKLKEASHEQLLSLKQAELAEEQNILDELLLAKSSLYVQLEEIGLLGEKPETYYDNLTEAYDHRNQLNLLEQQLTQRDSEQDPYSDQITDMEHAALQIVSYDKLNELTRLQEHQEFLLKLLTNKDSFIRKKIIDQNLNYLNTRLSFYLDKLGLPHTVTFLNDLSVSITELGRDLDFHNLSRGEGNRLILGLSWSFRDVWESLYRSINVLFLDEIVDSGMDGAGVETSIAMLKGFTRERGKSVWLISHRDELVPRVDSILKITKENGFTVFNSDIETV